MQDIMIEDAGRVDLTRPDIAEVSELESRALPGARLLGAHMPTAGGIAKSLLDGKEIGCTAVQLFTSSPRQWNQPPLKDVDVTAFHAARESTGIGFTVAHDSYLINLAAPDPYVLERSRRAFRGELDRAELLGIPWVVTHMGAHLDQGEAEAVARIVESLKLVLADTDAIGYKVGVALETTAGQGTGLGSRFEQIGEILRDVGHLSRLGVCLDTCHVFVAGYDIRGADAYEATILHFDQQIGLRHLKVIHANDAKKPLGSRVDRHDHIGAGEIGLDAFARFVTDPRLMSIPIIIETPESETMHRVNLQLLQRLACPETAGMQIRVKFFGHYSEYFGEAGLEVLLPTSARVSDLVAALATCDVRLVGLEQHWRFAVVEEYVTLDSALREGMSVVVLPPMSGG